jgi:hypothetical protein
MSEALKGFQTPKLIDTSVEGHTREPGEPLLREEPFEDSAPDQSGEDYLYYYAGWVGELFLDDRCYLLRRYEDTAEEVSFMAVAYGVGPEDDLMAPGAPQDRIRGGVPYSDPVFVKAARWLLGQPGVERLKVFTSDSEHPDDAYPPVHPERLSQSLGSRP